MRLAVRAAIMLLLAGAGAATAEDRFPVLEFFGRPAGQFCSDAGPAMRTLQAQYQGRALLLEYHYDIFRNGRLDRFWATGVSAQYLPLVMVGSGYRTSSGSVDYEPEYRALIEDDRVRPRGAELSAYWRRRGDGIRAYVTARNTAADNLRVDHDASIWLISFEERQIGVSSTWVRSATEWLLPHDLRPGESITAVIDSPPLSDVSWDHVRAALLVEHRSNGVIWDQQQAALAHPAAVTATPEQLRVNPVGGPSQVGLDGPHVLSWSAACDAPWLEVSPASGTLPADVTIAVQPDLRPPAALEATVTFSADGDGMSFETQVEVEIGSAHRRSGRRVRPAQ